MEFMHEKAWFMEAWTTVPKLVALQRFASLLLCNAPRALYSVWKNLGRDMAVGSSVRQARYWTVILLIGEGEHIWEGVHGDEVIYKPHADLCLSFVHKSRGPK